MLRDSFVILDSHGNMVGEQDNAQDALGAANKMAKSDGGHVWGDVDQLRADPVQNPPPEPLSPARCYRMTGLSEAARADGGIVTGHEGKALTGKPVYGFSRAQIMAMSLTEAHARLRDMLPAQRVNNDGVRPKGVGAWGTAGNAADSMLRVNAKTAKVAIAAFERQLGVPIKASSTGLSLLPHWLASRTRDMYGKPVLVEATGTDVYFPPGVQMGPSFFVNDEAAMRDHYGPDRGSSAHSFCGGSSRMCRATCLAYSGQNQVSDEAVVAKHALTQALMKEPRAFLRLLVEAIRKRMTYKGFGSIPTLKEITAMHEGDAELIRLELELAPRYAKIPLETWIRLNVYQDIPWELLCPDLYASPPAQGSKPGDWFPQLRSYDYTKVPGRGFFSNYDLTFSFSGDNLGSCLSELARGRNVAAVFVRTAEERLFSERKLLWSEKPLRQRHARELFIGITKPRFRDSAGKEHPFVDGSGRPLPVLNGDLHDIRPYDNQILRSMGWDGPAIIGLDFKIPRIKVGHNRRGDKEITKPLYTIEEAGKFVLRVKETAEGAKLMAVNGGMLDRIGQIGEIKERYEVL